MLKLEMPSFKTILEEAGGNEQLLEELLDEFRQWLKQQPHLPQGYQDISEQRLKYYIYSAKFNLEKAKKRLDSHYTIRNLIPEIYANRDPSSENMTQLVTYYQWIHLPKLSPENFRVSVFRFLHRDSSVLDVLTILKSSFGLVFETRIEEDTVNSDVIIVDCTNFTFGHMLKYTPSILKKADAILEAYGTRVKAIHMINAPTYINFLVTMVKLMMRKTKLVKRIHMYPSGIESLYKIIPRSILPADYGGEQPSMNTLADMWQAKLLERREWFREQEEVKANESLRSNSVIKPKKLFGILGIF